MGAILVVLAGCGSSAQPRTLELLGGKNTPTCRQVLHEVRRTAGKIPKDENVTVDSGLLAGSYESYAHSSAVRAFWDELVVLADQHPDCFSVRLRAQIGTYDRNSR